MNKFEDKILEEMKSENLVSYAERALRARITFAGERLTIINGMILKDEDLKVKGVSPAQIIENQTEFKNNREGLVANFSKKYSKQPNLNDIVRKHSQKKLNIRKDREHGITF